MLKVAQYAAQLEDYDKAIQIYEQVSTDQKKSILSNGCACNGTQSVAFNATLSSIASQKPTKRFNATF
jgi:Soluble NSF attachment protein, SNAP